jgi:hypothetical protein
MYSGAWAARAATATRCRVCAGGRGAARARAATVCGRHACGRRRRRRRHRHHDHDHRHHQIMQPGLHGPWARCAERHTHTRPSRPAPGHGTSPGARHAGRAVARCSVHARERRGATRPAPKNNKTSAAGSAARAHGGSVCVGTVAAGLPAVGRPPSGNGRAVTRATQTVRQAVRQACVLSATQARTLLCGAGGARQRAGRPPHTHTQACLEIEKGALVHTRQQLRCCRSCQQNTHTHAHTHTLTGAHMHGAAVLVQPSPASQRSVHSCWHTRHHTAVTQQAHTQPGALRRLAQRPSIRGQPPAAPGAANTHSRSSPRNRAGACASAMQPPTACSRRRPRLSNRAQPPPTQGCTLPRHAPSRSRAPRTPPQLCNDACRCAMQITHTHALMASTVGSDVQARAAVLQRCQRARVR